MWRDHLPAMLARAVYGLTGLLAILLSAAGSHAAGCTGAVKDITFANWAAAETATAKEVNASVAAFEKAHPCIQIRMVAIPFANMVSQLTVMTIGNNTPEVMELSSGMPQALAAQGALADLRQYADKALIADIQPSMLEDGKAGGKLVALPLSLTPHGFWYNKGLMQKAGLNPADPPRTIAELTKDIAIVKAKEPKVYPLAMPTSKGAYTMVATWPILQAFCKRVPMADNHLGWTQPCTEAAFAWLQQRAERHEMPVGNNMKSNRQLFATDQVAFTLDGPYMRGIVASINPAYAGNSAFAAEFGATRMPVGTSGTSHTAIDIHQIAISAKAADAKDAWAFVRFMVSSPDDMRDFILPEGGLPPLTSLQQQFKAELGQPYQQAWVTEIIPEAVPIPYNAAWFRASDSMVNALQKVVNGDDVKATLGALETELKRIYPHFQS
ncbi:MAG: ABC transporter substrate-binding protein [Acetobacteraceae bacterium]